MGKSKSTCEAASIVLGRFVQCKLKVSREGQSFCDGHAFAIGRGDMFVAGFRIVTGMAKGRDL